MYRGERTRVGQLVDGTPPWDIGAPQPEISGLLATGQIIGDVLDAGCGLGRNAVAFAEQGHWVTAFDAAPSVVERAKLHAAERGVGVDFELADATDLPDFGRSFDTIVDSALLHCLAPAQRKTYLDGLHRQAKPGAALHVLCFSDAQPPLSSIAHHLSAAELGEMSASGWHLAQLRPATITTSFPRSSSDRIAAATGRDVTEVLATLTVDEHGRYGCAAWLATASRM
jgi:SAM-dependent methyltransferase